MGWGSHGSGAGAATRRRCPCLTPVDATHRKIAMFVAQSQQRTHKAGDAMPVSDAYKSVPASIEVRSIDYVPDGERHGGLASQFSLWLAANLQITAIVTGALAVVFGGDVLWSLVALLLGQLIGGAVMALHAA